MKKIGYLIILLFILLPIHLNVKALNCDLLYFCLDYTTEDGESDCSDIFFAGEIDVMAYLSTPIYYTKVFIQFDKFDPKSTEFKYYIDYEFDVESDMEYINFGKINIEDRGIYRVFLLNPYKETITSALVEII